MSSSKLLIKVVIHGRNVRDADRRASRQGCRAADRKEKLPWPVRKILRKDNLRIKTLEICYTARKSSLLDEVVPHCQS